MPRTAVSSSPDPRWPETTPPGTECPGGICTITQEFHDEAFFLRQSYLGTREILHFHTNGGLSALLVHEAYFCPVCGEIWLRRVITPHSSYNRGPVQWQVSLLPCHSHGGGRIIKDYESLDFPLAVLRNDVLSL